MEERCIFCFLSERETGIKAGLEGDIVCVGFCMLYLVLFEDYTVYIERALYRKSNVGINLTDKCKLL